MENKPFLSSLFDFSFTSYVTPRFIKVIFIIGAVLTALATIGFIVSGFSMSLAVGIIFLILSPIFYIIYLLFVRIYLELMIILFRLQSDVAEILKNKKQ
jgi:hypothetical protein